MLEQSKKLQGPYNNNITKLVTKEFASTAEIGNTLTDSNTNKIVQKALEECNIIIQKN
ncbi:hypothetical protein [Clostridium guangxiense]|uniref:hypothetical protein n=1 Tax=Clostridium guangxiense TaxID=1662055 RepID=UPI001E5441A4|nr:hypothetical protein [Clostridium guangxiense]